MISVIETFVTTISVLISYWTAEEKLVDSVTSLIPPSPLLTQQTPAKGRGGYLYVNVASLPTQTGF